MVQDLPPDCQVMNQRRPPAAKSYLRRRGRAEVSTVGASFHRLGVPRALHLTPPQRTSCVGMELMVGLDLGMEEEGARSRCVVPDGGPTAVARGPPCGGVRARGSPGGAG